MTDTHHVIGRSDACNIIANATDKPLTLWMHHFHSRALLVNIQTGDILTQFFSNDSQQDAQQIFNNSVLSQLHQTLFLEETGEKVLFILKTNYKAPIINQYIEDLLKLGVTFGGEIVANVKEEHPEYEKFIYGEIPVGFTLDLSNTSHFNVSYDGDNRGASITQSVMPIVGTQPSNLPDFKALKQQYYQLSGIGSQIAYASDELAQQLIDSPVDLSTLSSLPNYFVNIVQDSIEKAFPFSSNHLYKADYHPQIINTLNLVQEHGLDILSVSALIGAAAQAQGSQVYRCGFDSPELFDMVEQGQQLFTFAQAFIQARANDDEKAECAKQMQDQFNTMHRQMFSNLQCVDDHLLTDELKAMVETPRKTIAKLLVNA
jgi:hypothetical protein